MRLNVITITYTHLQLKKNIYAKTAYTCEHVNIGVWILFGVVLTLQIIILIVQTKFKSIRKNNTNKQNMFINIASVVIFLTCKSFSSGFMDWTKLLMIDFVFLDYLFMS